MKESQLCNLKDSILDSIITSKCFMEGNFTLKSGKTSNFYLNLRNLISQPRVLKEIAQLIHQNLPREDDFLICGLPYAGIPYANTVSILYDIPGVILRKERKKHGLGNMIDGIVGSDIRKVVVIDDIMTTGSSIKESIPILKEHGLEIDRVICVIDRSEMDIKELEVEGIKYPIHSLFKLEELISYQK